MILFAIQISFRLDVFAILVGKYVLEGHSHELSPELTTVTERNIDTRCITIYIAIHVFYIAIYGNTLFCVSLHP